MAFNIQYAYASVGGDSGGERQLNSYPVQSQYAPDVLGLSGGGFVCAYNNLNPANGLVAVDFYNAAYQSPGFKLPNSTNPETDAVGGPKLAELSNGNVVVVWEDDNGAGGEAGMRGAIYSADGSSFVALDIDMVPGASDAGFGEIDVTALNAGGFVVSYSFGGNIYFRTYNDSGVQTGAAFNVVTTSAGTQADTQITTLSDGAFAITWTDTFPADQLIKGRIFEANGTARTGELTIASGADNTKSSVAATPGGGFAVAYVDSGWGGDPDAISLQLVSGAGVAGGPIKVNPNTPGLVETDPSVAVLPNGFIVVSWSRPNSVGGVDSDIHAKVFDAAGATLTSVSFLASAAVDEVAPSVSALGGGRFITSWQSAVTDGDGGQIAGEIGDVIRTVTGDGANDVYAGDALRESIIGAGGNDSLRGATGNDTLLGGDGVDTLLGEGGNDRIEGGPGGDSLSGGEGNDLIYGNTSAMPGGAPPGDSIDGGGGKDRVRAGVAADAINGGDGDDKLNGGGGNDAIDGGVGHDKLKGQAGDDTLGGGLDADQLNGGGGDDVIYGATAAAPDSSASGDTLNGAHGHDLIHGAAGNDRMFGLAGKDTLDGRAGHDTLEGGTYRDSLNGGFGQDVLTGGADKDFFIYEEVSDSGVGGFNDLITDLGNRDVVVLSAIDANTGVGGDQAFTLVAAFTGAAGQVVVAYQTSGFYSGKTTIEGDVDGDGVADLTIAVEGDKHNFANFVL